ncbi:MarR family winged helix-turn-helix transcriptional regulator [Streptomyces mirabilis]|jgi:DNA-binding MarR family transcriptional regulator|uniref:MarR family winged helix-turn-helix transcriptional regulator n=1 Tax=Streptomyces TaxID=1883 RepID=UPI000BB0D355|nr:MULTISPECIES: MarR family transcriptional regulator [unclassified Streptomyces]PBD00753.1 MarR family transcriptional regulator [Streptomyces sp. Ag82_O1-15]SOE77560.1 transcriptional regulator, MarR family [Streptomyces sp. OV198]
MSTPPPTPADPALTDVAEIERALTRISYLTSRVRQHERLMVLAGLALDRAAVALLRQVADSGSLRPSELANLLSVEASHVTRQVQQLEKTGYLTRVPDPNDRRAQRIELTPAGRDAVDRVREASCRGMSVALADWSPGDLEQLATLCHRLADDFFAHAEDEIDLLPEVPREV